MKKFSNPKTNLGWKTSSQSSNFDHSIPVEKRVNVTEKGGRVGLLYLTSVFSYNLDFTSGATRPCKIFSYISNTEVSI